MVNEYIRATVQAKGSLYRVYCHHGQIVSRLALSQLLECDFSEVCIDNVQPVDEFDLDDPLEIIMIDESGIYFW